MDKLNFKREIIRQAEWLIEQKEADFSEEIDRLREASAYQPEEQDTLVKIAMDDDAKDEITSLMMESNFAHDQLLHLIGLEKVRRILDRVEPGAVVFTDRGTFFISVAAGDMVVDGMTIQCISPEAPIYRAMLGKSKGDTFAFRDQTYFIRDLF